SVLLTRFQTDTHMYATKYSPDGAVIWSRQVVEEPGMAPRRAAISRNGSIYVAGSGYDVAPLNFLARMDPATGMVTWRVHFAFEPYVLATDSANHVIVGERGLNNMATITKREPVAGAIDWQRSFDNAAYKNFPNAIAVDSGDNVLVTGGQVPRPGDTVFAVIKL